eukprot:jgi/Mesen1/5398/ME000268S04599
MAALASKFRSLAIFSQLRSAADCGVQLRPRDRALASFHSSSSVSAKNTTEATEKVKVKKEKVKKEKDPNGPKKPLTSYFHFVKDQFEKTKLEHPEQTTPQIGKLLGQKWKALSETEKEPYAQKAAQDKARYSKEIADAAAAPKV